LLLLSKGEKRGHKAFITEGPGAGKHLETC
jgi:hypothetical protein